MVDALKPQGQVQILNSDFSELLGYHYLDLKEKAILYIGLVAHFGVDRNSSKIGDTTVTRLHVCAQISTLISLGSYHGCTQGEGKGAEPQGDKKRCSQDTEVKLRMQMSDKAAAPQEN